MKREEKDRMPERDEGTQTAIGPDTAPTDTAADAAPHWQSFYAAVREAIAAMRPGSDT
jgi:hypothetical protein